FEDGHLYEAPLLQPDPPDAHIRYAGVRLTRRVESEGAVAGRRCRWVRLRWRARRKPDGARVRIEERLCIADDPGILRLKRQVLAHHRALAARMGEAFAPEQGKAGAFDLALVLFGRAAPELVRAEWGERGFPVESEIRAWLGAKLLARMHYRMQALAEAKPPPASPLHVEVRRWHAKPSPRDPHDGEAAEPLADASAAIARASRPVPSRGRIPRTPEPWLSF
ncbi:MAG: hypothetical protein D6771_04225, partial [Zetaproteobacteria bacterium]